MAGLARTRVTPTALTAAGVALCIARRRCSSTSSTANELLFFWLGAAVFVLGSILDILDGALARAGGKATPFGAFLDSTTDRVGEAFMLGAIALVFARDGNEIGARASRSRRSPARSSSATRARRRRCSACKGDVGIGSRAERVVVITAGLVFAPVGRAAVGDLLLAATAWLTVVQRIWYVRRQLLEPNETC